MKELRHGCCLDPVVSDFLIECRARMFIMSFEILSENRLRFDMLAEDPFQTTRNLLLLSSNLNSNGEVLFIFLKLTYNLFSWDMFKCFSYVKT